MKRKFWWLALAALGLLTGSMYMLGHKVQAPESTFVFLDGAKVQTSQLKGQVYLVNFWATSCASCVQEMPSLASTFEKYKGQGFGTIAVAMKHDPPSYVVNFSESRKLPFHVAIDNTGAVANAWGPIELTPTTFLVNKKGEVVKRFIGPPNFADLHLLIEKLLKEA
jgi:peroxiredoxin